MIAPAAGPHGGDGAILARALGRDPSAVLDLSASLNPLAPDPIDVLRRHLGAVRRYPDTTEASHALAHAMEVEPARLLLTNGGAEAISLVAAHLRTGWVEEPEFSLYRRHLQAIEPGAPRWRSNPHNPSGLLAGSGEQAAVWDEAFFPLATGCWTRRDSEQGAIVVGSLTKLLACPGLRVGYVVSPDPKTARQVADRQPQWALNGLAAAALPELLDRVDLPSWAESIADLRSELAAVLGRAGFEPMLSDANWLLVHAPGLRDKLAVHAIAVRDCTSFGMPGTVRIAVPDRDGLDRLAAALDQLAHERLALKARRRRRALMICGTTSDSGKSTIVTGLCRILARRGVKVAPFKAQNMALNSAVTAGGQEIGRAQAAQAQAAGVEAEVAMNPVLLKPSSDRASQVVVMGRPWATLGAAQYQTAKPELWEVVRAQLEELRRRFDVVLCEGAGSPTEINLLSHDIVNLRVAEAGRFPSILVGDIERGGVFAALYGTVALLPDKWRPLVRGFVINKFRGDPALLGDGPKELARRTGVPTLGVIPWLHDIAIDAEDSIALGRESATGQSGGVGDELDVAVVRFPRIANFTDLDPLAIEDGLQLRLVGNAAALGRPDLIILPGTKTTVADMEWLHTTGLANAIKAVMRPATRCTVVGVCGGYQMLGEAIDDSAGVEMQQPGVVPGLGLLPAHTTFQPRKVTRKVKGMALGQPVEGYFIHHGRTEAAHPWVQTPEGPEGSCAGDGAIVGTSLHGLFESDSFRRVFLAQVADRAGKVWSPRPNSFAGARQARFDALADALEHHLDIDRVEQLIREGSR